MKKVVLLIGLSIVAGSIAFAMDGMGNAGGMNNAQMASNCQATGGSMGQSMGQIEPNMRAKECQDRMAKMQSMMNYSAECTKMAYTTCVNEASKLK